MMPIFSTPKGACTKIINEQVPLQGISDGRFYVIAAKDDMFFLAIKSVVDFCFKQMDKNALIYTYEICCIEDITMFYSSESLYDAVNEGANVVLPICTPCDIGKKYLVSDFDMELLDVLVPSMIMQAENLTKAAIEEALVNLAFQESETCGKTMEMLCHTITDQAIGYKVGDMAMAPTKGSYETVFSEVTYQKSREIFTRFPENCKIVKKAEKMANVSKRYEQKLNKAKGEIDYVFNQIWGADKNFSSIRAVFLNQSPKQLRDSFDNYIDRERIAASSKITILVEFSDKSNEGYRKNDGKYRVYASDGEKKKLIHFERKPSCIIYIMYLLDRQKRGDDVNAIDISKNQDVFCALYSMIYGVKTQSELDGVFKNMTSKIIDGKVKQKPLKYYYQDIRNVVQHIVEEEFHEVALPFIIPNEKSHVSILSQNILIPKDLCNVSFVY